LSKSIGKVLKKLRSTDLLKWAYDNRRKETYIRIIKEPKKVDERKAYFKTIFEVHF